MVTEAPLGIGLIGCGGIARRAHLPALSVLGGRARLVATADIAIEAARAAAEPWGAQAFADYRDLLSRPDIAAVIIATPEAMHCEQTCAAAALGKHVLCEKPMCTTLEEADTMIAACQRAGVRLQIGHSRRFTTRYLRVHEALRAGTIGEVRLLRENERRPRSFQGLAGVMWTPRHWTGDPQRNLGVAMIAGIHESDILRWFAGSEPVSVFAEHSVTTEGNIGVPDFMSMTVRFANGAIGSSELSRMVPDSYPAFHQLELYGTQGSLRARDTDSIGCVEYRDGAAGFPAAQETFLRHGPHYVRQLTAFLDSIAGRPGPGFCPRDSRAALRLSLAAIRSASTGQVVSLRDH